jgi:predicted kinase
MTTAYLLLGVQGAGKSTWAAANAGRLQAVVLASDTVRNQLAGAGQAVDAYNSDPVFAIFNERLREYLQTGRNVISDATHARRVWRRDEIMIGRSVGAHLVGVWFDLPLAVCLQRNAQRRGEAWGNQAVPEEYLRQVAAQFEPPAGDEFDEVWRVRD